MTERLNKDSEDSRSTASRRASVPSAEPLSPIPNRERGRRPNSPNDIVMRALADGPMNTYGNANRKKHNVREYTLGEEIANSITHGLGIALAIAAIPILVVIAVGNGGGIRCSLRLYTRSRWCSVHDVDAVPRHCGRRGEAGFQGLDTHHSCIYLFIAGSYTPFCSSRLPFGRRLLARSCGSSPVGGMRGVLGVSAALDIGCS